MEDVLTQFMDEVMGASPVPAAKPEKPRRRRHREVRPIELKSGRYWNLSENILQQFADTDRFHTMAEILARLDPQRSLQLQEKHIKPAIRALDGRKDVHLETRKAAKGQKHYKFFRQGKMIGLAVLKAKFKPVIEDLKAQAAMPISHQSAGRFHAAAALLTQVLRDLEA